MGLQRLLDMQHKTPDSQATRAAPSEVFGWRPYCLAAAASLGAVEHGYSSHVGSLMHLPGFQRAFNLQPEDVTDVTARIYATFAAGAFIGNVAGYLLGERFGRKSAIVFSSVFTLLGVVAELNAQGNLALMYAARVLVGFGAGMKVPMLAAYVAEISPPSIRGKLVGMLDIFGISASIPGFWVCYAVGRHISPERDLQWRLPVAIQMVPAGLLILALGRAIESPRWLVDHKLYDRAARNLAWVRHLPVTHVYVEKELDEMRKQAEVEDQACDRQKNMFTARWKELLSGTLRRRIVLILLLKTTQSLSGIDMLNSYGPQLFQKLGFGTAAETMFMTGIYGCVKAFVNTILVLFLLDAMGRRKPLLAGTTVMIGALLYLGIYTQIARTFDRGVEHRDAAGYVAIFATYLFAAGYAISWAIVPLVYASEIFPTRVRTLALAFVFTLEWGLGFGIMYAIPYALERMKFGTFYFFAACLCVGGVGAWMFMPETKGLQLEQMDMLFAEPRLSRHARRRVDGRLQEDAATAMAQVSVEQVDVNTAGQQPSAEKTDAVQVEYMDRGKEQGTDA